MKKSYTYNLRVWLWPGDMPWHFVTLPRELYVELRQRFPRGMVKVRATIGQSSWDTSLFPHRESESYIMPIKKAIREKEGIFAGDVTKITIELL